MNGYPAIFNKYEGYLHSGKLMQWMHQQVKEAGVEIRWGCPVKSVQSDHVVLQDGETIKASKVILATNGYSSEISDEANIDPARGYVFVTNELKKMQWKGTWHYDQGYVYFRNVGNRLLLGGGRNVDMKKEQSSEDYINPLIKAYLIQFAREVLRLEENWTIDYEWTGIMGFGSTKTPQLRKMESGAWLAAGLGGMGVALGLQFGKDVATEIIK